MTVQDKKTLKTVLLLAILCLAPFFGGHTARATPLTTYLEVKTLFAVGDSWRTVTLDNSYVNAVPICTHVLASSGENPASVRIQNIASTSFQVKVQGWGPAVPSSPSTVHCVIMEAGAHTLPGGLKVEALTVTSTFTHGQNATHGWNLGQTQNITASLFNSYAAPRLLAAIISYNDTAPSAVWASDCDNRGNQPFLSGQADGACVSKMIGQISGSRADETIGVIVIDDGSITANGVTLLAGRGSDSVRGVGNGPPYNYAVTGDFDGGIVHQAGEDGGQGGWAVLYGLDPLPNGSVRLAIDEETIAGDTSRTHTTEAVDYLLFDDTNAPAWTFVKTAVTASFSEVGDIITYDYQVTNTGNTAINAISIADDKIASVSCPSTSLSVGAAMTCSASYSVVAADVAAGFVTNNASVTGTPSAGALPDASDSATVTILAGSATLDATKTTAVYDPGAAGLYAVPGNDVLYTITVSNLGAGAVDTDTVVIIDTLPGEVQFYNGDIDGAGPELNPVAFTDDGSGLSFTYATDVAFSNAASKPTSFAGCTYTPAGGYDSAVKHVCFNPKGSFLARNPDPSFTVRFRAGIR